MAPLSVLPSDAILKNCALPPSMLLWSAIRARQRSSRVFDLNGAAKRTKNKHMLAADFLEK